MPRYNVSKLMAMACFPFWRSSILPSGGTVPFAFFLPSAAWVLVGAAAEGVAVEGAAAGGAAAGGAAAGGAVLRLIHSFCSFSLPMFPPSVVPCAALAVAAYRLQCAQY